MPAKRPTTVAEYIAAAAPKAQEAILKIFGLGLMSLLATGTMQASTPPAPVQGPLKLDPVVLTGTIEVNGSISGSQCGPAVADNICKAMLDTVSGWQFKPGTRNGQAAAMDVLLNVGLVAIPREKGYSLQVTSAKIWAKPLKPLGLASSPFGKRRPPIYPMEDLKRGRTGIVDAEIMMQPPSDTPRIGRLWFNGVESDRRQPMVKAATDAMKDWQLPASPPEQLTQCVVLEFSLDKAIPGVADRISPCKPTFAEGFALPQLLTKVGFQKPSDNNTSEGIH